MASRGLARLLAVAVFGSVLAGIGVGSCALAGCWASSPAGREGSAGAIGPGSPSVTSPAGRSGSGQKGRNGQQGRPGTSLLDGQAAWMMTRAALSTMMSASTVGTRLKQKHIYEILQPGQQPLPGVSAVPVVTFSSVADLRTALADRQIPQGAGAVLYDDENWPFTPTAEQQNPVQAATQAADLAHSHGLQLIVAPALDLLHVLAPGTPGQDWQRYIRLGLAGAMAKVADVVELQAQSLERDPGTYAAFVSQATAQARAANPRVTMLAGLSTNPPGTGVTTSMLTSAIAMSQSAVDGYWLNIPGPGPRCPACNAPQPAIGAAVLGDVL
jgi:hypothetical protein